MNAKIPTTRAELLARLAELRAESPRLTKATEEHTAHTNACLERARREPKDSIASAMAAELAVAEAAFHRLHSLVAAMQMTAAAREGSYIARELERMDRGN